MLSYYRHNTKNRIKGLDMIHAMNSHDANSEFVQLDTLPPFESELDTIQMNEVEISEEYKFFFEIIIGDLERSLDDSYKWMQSNTVAA